MITTPNIKESSNQRQADTSHKHRPVFFISAEALVVNLIANGMTTDEILVEYPDLEAEDIREALQYAASLASEEVHPFSI